MKNNKIKVLLIGHFADILIEILKEIFSNFEIDRIDPMTCSEDYFLRLIYDDFRPHIILININTYAKNREFYDGNLAKKLSKVCFRIVSMPEIWEKDTLETRELLKNYIETILKELERKNS